MWSPKKVGWLALSALFLLVGIAAVPALIAILIATTVYAIQWLAEGYMDSCYWLLLAAFAAIIAVYLTGVVALSLGAAAGRKFENC